MAKEIFCGFGVDVDAVAGWLGSYGGEDFPDDISRGLFAGEVGSPRLLKLFARLGIKTTWFIPGGFVTATMTSTHREPKLAKRHAAATAAWHCTIASALNFRGVDREMRWR
jgi:peptidoglycan/xylan/chitin deacetylase (PgdA/CDA1 family)